MSDEREQAEQDANLIAENLLGAPVVKAIGGVRRIETRSATDEEKSKFGGSLMLGDVVVFHIGEN